MAGGSTGVKRSALFDGDRQLRSTAARFGEEFRLLRLRFGLTQAAVARAIGVSRSVICRLEAGGEDIGARIRARAVAVLGADFRLGLYPVGEPLIRDAAHARLVERLLTLRHPGWLATVEAPVPGPGRRSTDVRLERARDIVLFEVETRVTAWELIVRESHDKRAAVQEAAGNGRTIHVVLVLPPTRGHRALVAAHPQTVRAAYPVDSHRLRAALVDPTHGWPGDGILWLGSVDRRAGTREP